MPPYEHRSGPNGPAPTSSDHRRCNRERCPVRRKVGAEEDVVGDQRDIRSAIREHKAELIHLLSIQCGPPAADIRCQSCRRIDYLPLKDGWRRCWACGHRWGPEDRSIRATRPIWLMSRLGQRRGAEVGSNFRGARVILRYGDRVRAFDAGTFDETSSMDMREYMGIDEETPCFRCGRRLEERLVIDSRVLAGRDILAALATGWISVRFGSDGRPSAGPAYLLDEADRGFLAAHREAVIAALWAARDDQSIPLPLAAEEGEGPTRGRGEPRVAESGEDGTIGEAPVGRQQAVRLAQTSFLC